jgi:hypothetical protein
MAITSLQRPGSYPFCGRLIVLSSGRTQPYDPFPGLSAFQSINFPSMPDSLELNRTVEYFIVNSQVMPDGYHQYKWTNPLTIPFSFRLHAFDKDYCPQGSLSVLQVASLLHAMSLPLAQNGVGTTVNVTTQMQNPGAAPPTDANANASNGQSATTAQVSNASEGDFAPPVTLRLELIFTDENNPGIVCTGYVKDVKVKLNGPWLRAPGRAQNLPTSGDFEFTFVHVPGYGNSSYNLLSSQQGENAVGTTEVAQAFGDDVRQKFYNTVDLTKLSTANYVGFSQ